MRLPLSWLQELYPHDLDIDRLSSIFTMGVAEVDAVEDMEGEPVFVLTQKPDRGDLLSVEGLARELSVLIGSRFPERYPIPGEVDGETVDLPSGQAIGIVRAHEEGSTLGLPVRIEDLGLCRRYVACLLDGVNVSPSPEWLQRRIRQMGQRPVNNVVDAAQYIMFQTGQPFHAFDRDRLNGPEIRVRLAREGETLRALNGELYLLTSRELLIADAEVPIVIAGVMGGVDTEVGEGASRLLLESACFDPVSIRLTSRALDLKSESSMRFERVVDPNGCLRGMVEVVSLIADLTGGKVVGEIVDAYPRPATPETIRFRPERARRLLGMSIADSVMVDVFDRLGLQVEVEPRGPESGEAATLVVTAPTRRPDLEIEEDLVEEVIRVIGYDELPTTLPVGSTTPGQILPQRQAADQVRDALTGAGYTEVRSYSLTSRPALDRTGETGPVTQLRNPMTADHSVLRPTLLPALLEAAETNLARGVRNQHLFEIGRVFRPQPDQPAPLETIHIAGLALGTAYTAVWNRRSEEVTSDFYAMKGVLEGLAAALRLAFETTPSDSHPLLHPGRGARVLLPDGQDAGFMGELHPTLAARLSLTPRPIVFELAFDPIFQAHAERAHRPVDTDLSRLPSANRDLAVVVAQSVLAADVMAAVRTASPLLVEARLFDVYRGPGIGDDEQSLAISLVLRSPDRTLTDAEANILVDGVVSLLADRFGARRR